MKKYFLGILKRKTRTELIEEKIKDLLYDLFLSDYTDMEIAFILNSLREQCLENLEKNKTSLLDKLQNTESAIKNLKN